MTTPKIKHSKYSGVKVTNTIRALKLKSINKLLNIDEKNCVSLIDNYYNTHKYIKRDDMCYIWKLYWNFVLNDYRH